MQDNPLSAIEILWERTSDYLETKIQLIKLNAIDKASHIISAILSQLIILVIAAFVMFLLNIGVALWIGSLLGKLYYGFFILSAFYLLIGILIFIFKKKWIKKPINNFLIKELLK
jgi:putative superfamily III holin-X